MCYPFQVEEKPDVTYADIGGCKEQIDKMKEVVETPLLHVRFAFCIFCFAVEFLIRLNLRLKVNCYSGYVNRVMMASHRNRLWALCIQRESALCCGIVVCK